MGGASTQQLLLVSAADLQEAPPGLAPAPLPESLEDGVLQADGAARPRKRRTIAAAASAGGEGRENQTGTATDLPSGPLLDDQPRWHWVR